MKSKMLMAAMLLMAATGTRAQYSDYYYHRVGDTIEWRSEIGYYNWWEFEYYFDNDLYILIDGRNYSAYGGEHNFFEKDSVVTVQRYYTPTPLRVVGLAGGCMRMRCWLLDCFGEAPYFQYMDTNQYKNYFVIYDAMPDSFPLVGQLEWNPFDPYRVLHIQTHNHFTRYGDTTCCNFSPAHEYLPIYEYYFDEPITVEDSFYVGGTFFGEDLDVQGGIRTGYYTALTDSYGLRNPSCEAAYTEVGEDSLVYCLMEPVLYKTKYGLHLEPNNPGAYLNRWFSDPQWEWFTKKNFNMLVYPIVEVDTTVLPIWACPPVSNIAVSAGGAAATVTWDNVPNYSRVLLRYGNRNLPQEQWTEVDVTGNTLYTLTELEPQKYYGLSMMAECDTCKKETLWSEPLYFYSGVDTSNGIEGGETLLSRLTFLQPNPARNEVQVTSSFNLLSVEIWTVDGVMVYHGDHSGHDVTVDVSWLRTGTYLVAIRTHAGTTHKRLLIAR